MLPLTSIHHEMKDENLRSCVHNTVRDLFIHGKAYQETSQYQRMVNGLLEGKALYKCQTKEDIDHYFDNLLKAYRSIQSDGYKSQKELGSSSRDEVRLHITENGSLCLGSKGNHRFRMAELLGIQQIPCNVYGVNINWLTSLSQETNLPPHQAFLNWMKDPISHQTPTSSLSQ